MFRLAACLPLSAVCLPLGLLTLGLLALPAAARAEAPGVDFNRDIRGILSNKCFTCHGPDDDERQAGLRLDNRDGAVAELPSGLRAVVPGKPEESELLARVETDDEDLRMPPADVGEKLTEREVELLRRWIASGADFARHWSYVAPTRPEPPAVSDSSWPRNPIDHFILARLDREGLRPSPPASPAALVRRLSLDLTGLPPTVAEVDEFLADTEPGAYERLVDRLLDKKSYGEHWARKWLDLARYADSAGYADDPPRTIWAFRDYVIQSLNANKPFDQFTVEQIAGDLLPDPTPEQLTATAFHRNTLTNNEGGTNDEEFRNVAVVDRVNTTMAVWMGTTINCAQCHNHKYDPISQEEFFRLFAIFNNSADADRRDESPLLEVWTDEQQEQKRLWQEEIGTLEKLLTTLTPELAERQREWERSLAVEPRWQTLTPKQVELESGTPARVDAEGAVLVPEANSTNRYTLTIPLNLGGAPDSADAPKSAESPGSKSEKNKDAAEPAEKGELTRLTALRLEALPDPSLPGKGPGHAGGNFVVTRVLASVVPPEGIRPRGRFLRIELPGQKQILSLAEVQVFSGGQNIAPGGKATQSSTDYDGPPQRAIDGNTEGNYDAMSVTHTAQSADPWWELDLQSAQAIDQVVVWNRTDNNLHTRLKNFRIQLLDEQRGVVWEKSVADSPHPQAAYSVSGVRPIQFAAAYADHSQPGFSAGGVLDEKQPNQTGWAIGPQTGQPHTLTLVASSAVELPAGSQLTVTIEQLSSHENHTLGRFRLAMTNDARVSELARIPAAVLAAARVPAAERSEEQARRVSDHYLSIAPELREERQRLEKLRKQLADIKPATTVPIMRELPENQQRTTKIQRRGNFLDTTREVTPGVPAAFHSLEQDATANRLALAHWLVDDRNPLTARVIVNRYWEAIFGRGLVLTSEEFGSQGELPSHPQLLDWLATELVASDWDLKHLLKLLVTSATYRQTSAVTPELLELDPDNRLLARGPRFRLSAETIRDQALFVSGLLSDKMYGPPVKPPQPSIGLSAAFGSGIDWKTSEGEDRYRRGLYTTWRRSNPYPSMAAFDAPNREVCTVRRDRTNTPLQALVTLNDPVYVEAAQSLARRLAGQEGDVAAKARRGFRMCLARQPSDAELAALVRLYEQARERYAASPDQARRMATVPLGEPPEGMDVTDLAAWTVVGNVLLNLDEMFMKR